MQGAGMDWRVFPKSTKRETQTKSFVKGDKKIAEQERLLGYYYISQKFLSVDVWFGLCENSHNAKAKNKEYKNIVIFSNKRTKCPKSVYVRGRDVFCGKFVRSGPNSRKTFTYMVGDNFFAEIS